jgi:hypothetical protein
MPSFLKVVYGITLTAAPPSTNILVNGLPLTLSLQVQRPHVSIPGRLVKGGLLSQHQLRHQYPELLILIDIWRHLLLYNLVSGCHELIRQKIYHACLSRTTRSLRLVFWAPHLFPIDSRLLQFLVPQALNSSLLALP